MIAFNEVSATFVVVYLLGLFLTLWLEWLNSNHVRRFGTKVPEPFQGFIDEERFARMNAYTLDKTRLSMKYTLVMDSILLVLIVSGFFVSLDRVLGGNASRYLWSGWLFFLSVGVLFAILDLPWDSYETFVIEEKFGFNRSTFTTWVTDKLKGAVISVILLTVTAVPLLWLIKDFPRFWWVLVFALFSLLQLFLIVLYPILIAPLFNTFEPLADKLLEDEVNDLVRRVGLKPSGVFQMDAGRRSTHSNAYFTGLGKTKRVVLFDTLLEKHSREEILGVLAHELGHFKLKHVLKGFLVGEAVLLVGFAVTYLIMNWPLFHETFGFDPARPYLGLFVIGIFLRRAAFLVSPVRTALSRRFERQADSFASDILGEPRALAAALKKLAKDNLSNLNPHPFYAWFHYSHPPVGERVSALESLLTAVTPEERMEGARS